MSERVRGELANTHTATQTSFRRRSKAAIVQRRHQSDPRSVLPYGHRVVVSQESRRYRTVEKYTHAHGTARHAEISSD